MHERHSNTALVAAIALLAAGGVLSLLTGLYPGLLLLLVAIGLGVAQRSRLARAVRTPDTDLRRRRLRTGAILGATFVATYTLYILTIGDHWTIRETILAIVGNLAMFGSIGYLVAGLLTPRSASVDPLPAGR